MDDEYARNVERVMSHMAAKGRSGRTMARYRDCFDRLSSHLAEVGLPYSDAAAREWLDSVGGGFGEATRDIYTSAVAKLSDVYSTGTIGAYHRRAPVAEDRLGERNREALGGYRAHLAESGLAPDTVLNRSRAATRLMLDLQSHGVGFVGDATHADVIRALLEGHRRNVRGLLAWLHSEGMVSYGITLLPDAIALKKGYCWNGVDPDEVEALRAAQGEGAISPDEYLGLVDGLVDEMRGLGYSRTTVRETRHLGRLLYLFMDANGLLYDPAVGLAWLGSMRGPLSDGEFSTCRRTVLLVGQIHEGVPHDHARPFRFRETARDRLPGWCAPAVDGFLAMKAAEGWRKSTLTMFSSSVCRFCVYVDGAGVTDFSDLTAEHVKSFNVDDPHETPEGKNAYNSRIRQFLAWLGLRGELSNPNLFLALPNVAAPRVDTPVTLTPGERERLEGLLAGEGDASLRDLAMLQLGLHLGMRASDVVGLRAQDIDWRADATVRFEQAKTRREVHLPMPADVANALYRYIVRERPKSRETSVFLQARAPFAPIGTNAARRALDKALPDRHVDGSGFHVLRRTFASSLLGCGATPTQVAEALGHHGTSSVGKYLSLDEERMRLCAISLEESGLELEGGFGDVRP